MLRPRYAPFMPRSIDDTLRPSPPGLKLVIALSDRYALGFWSTDAYALKLNIVKSGSSGAQQVANAASFYTSSSAIASFDNRLAHILSHQNSLMGGKTWAELDSVVYAFEGEHLLHFTLNGIR